MGRKQKRLKIIFSRRTAGGFTAWPHQCSCHPNFVKRSHIAKSLLLYFLGEYRGYNNGDLSCAWKLMKDTGWNSRTTIEKARKELEQFGWIVRTRQGYRNKCNLYALTMYSIDECDGKLDVRSTARPLDFWRHSRNPWFEDQKTERPPPKSFAKPRTRASSSMASTDTGQ
jgi:hypothetical protein